MNEMVAKIGLAVTAIACIVAIILVGDAGVRTALVGILGACIGGLGGITAQKYTSV